MIDRIKATVSLMPVLPGPRCPLRVMAQMNAKAPISSASWPTSTRTCSGEPSRAWGLRQHAPLGLVTLAHGPWRVILNITAGHAQRMRSTLNSIGRAVCPYRIQLQDVVFGEIHEAGYRRRDVWRNDDKPIVEPFVAGGDRAFYFGCCFDRQ